MELLETQDPEKKRLMEESDRHKQELQKEVKAMSDKTEKVVKNALIIGGALAITYLIVSQLGSSRKKKNKKAKSIPTFIPTSYPLPPSPSKTKTFATASYS